MDIGKSIVIAAAVLGAALVVATLVHAVGTRYYSHNESGTGLC